MASFSLAFPSLARCERPSAASLRISGVQPGRLAQGPEEKRALCGRAAGAFAILTILSDGRLSLGRGVPLMAIREPAGDGQAVLTVWEYCRRDLGWPDFANQARRLRFPRPAAPLSPPSGGVWLAWPVDAGLARS